MRTRHAGQWPAALAGTSQLHAGNLTSVLMWCHSCACAVVVLSVSLCVPLPQSHLFSVLRDAAGPVRHPRVWSRERLQTQKHAGGGAEQQSVRDPMSEHQGTGSTGEARSIGPHSLTRKVHLAHVLVCDVPFAQGFLNAGWPCVWTGLLSLS